MLGNRIFKAALVGLAFGGMVGVSTAKAGDIEWNGFGSLYYGQALEPKLLAPVFTDSKADFSTFSLFGLNVGGKLTEEMSVATQLVAASQAATGTWGMSANWAYLNYQPTSALAFKLGRQLFPIFIGSEYDKVAQLLPYRRIPGISTLSPFSGFDGVSGAYTFDFGGTKLTISAFGGRPNYELTASSKAAGYVGVADELLGATATLDGDGWRIRGMYNRLRATLTNTTTGATTCPSGTGGCSALVDQFSFGYRWDKYNFVSWGEVMGRTGYEGTTVGTTRYLSSLKGGYVLLGYRIGDIMPRYTYTRSDALIGVGTGGYDAHSIGINYALSPMATFKVDYEMYRALDNGSYGLTYVAPGTLATLKEASAVYAGVDFIF